MALQAKHANMIIIVLTLVLLALCIVVVAKKSPATTAAEYFALSNAVVNNTSKIDLNKFYYPGKRVKSVTITPGKNTTAVCNNGVEFPGSAWKLADPVAPTCMADVDDSVYDFNTTGDSTLGMYLRGFNIKHASGRQRCLHPWGGVNPEGTQEVNASWVEGQCNQPTSFLTRGPDGLIKTTNGKCLYASRNGTENNDVLHFGQYCDQPFDFKNGKLFHRNSGKCVHPKGGDFQGNDQDAVLHSDNCGVGIENTANQFKIGVDMSTDGINQFTLDNNGTVFTH